MLVSEPRALKMPASSTAMYPAPTTTTFLQHKAKATESIHHTTEHGKIVNFE
jgi:hypothetical protein